MWENVSTSGYIYLIRSSLSKPSKLTFWISFLNCRFAEKSHLVRHYSFHSEIRPFKCDVCQKMYKTERCLKVHSLVHAPARPFVCGHCSKGFLSSTKLKVSIWFIHVRIFLDVFNFSNIITFTPENDRTNVNTANAPSPITRIGWNTRDDDTKWTTKRAPNCHPKRAWSRKKRRLLRWQRLRLTWYRRCPRRRWRWVWLIRRPLWLPRRLYCLQRRR